MDLDGIAPRQRLARRLRAARAIAGFSNTARLADALGGSPSDKSLRLAEQAKRTPSPEELRRIADACHVADGFFYIRLDGAGETQGERIRRLRELRDLSTAELGAQVRALLARITRSSGQATFEFGDGALVAEWEANERAPSAVEVEALALALDVAETEVSMDEAGVYKSAIDELRAELAEATGEVGALRERVARVTRQRDEARAERVDLLERQKEDREIATQSLALARRMEARERVASARARAQATGVQLTDARAAVQRLELDLAHLEKAATKARGDDARRARKHIDELRAERSRAYHRLDMAARDSNAAEAFLHHVESDLVEADRSRERLSPNQRTFMADTLRTATLHAFVRAAIRAAADEGDHERIEALRRALEDADAEVARLSGTHAQIAVAEREGVDQSVITALVTEAAERSLAAERAHLAVFELLGRDVTRDEISAMSQRQIDSHEFPVEGDVDPAATRIEGSADNLRPSSARSSKRA